MKQSILLALSFLVIGCAQQPSQECQAFETANANLEKSLENVRLCLGRCV